MNLLRNGLLMRKTGDRRRSDMSEKYAFVCSFSAEFITLSRPTQVGTTRGVAFRVFVRLGSEVELKVVPYFAQEEHGPSRI